MEAVNLKAVPMSGVESGMAVSTIPTDAAIAASIRAELATLLEQVCVILNRARHHGLNVNFNCGLDTYGRHRPSPVDVAKPL